MSEDSGSNVEDLTPASSFEAVSANSLQEDQVSQQQEQESTDPEEGHAVSELEEEQDFEDSPDDEDKVFLDHLHNLFEPPHHHFVGPTDEPQCPHLVTVNNAVLADLRSTVQEHPPMTEHTIVTAGFAFNIDAMNTSATHAPATRGAITAHDV